MTWLKNLFGGKPDNEGPNGGDSHHGFYGRERVKERRKRKLQRAARKLQRRLAA